MRMKKLGIMAIFLMLFFSGCINNNSITGTYYHNETRASQRYFNYIEHINESLTIYDDNTFFYKDIKNDISSSGVITRHGDELVFTGQLGMSFIGKFQNDSIVTDSGIFIKQR
jgi:hypothetical protein